MANMNNTQKVNEIKFNGNCKGVRDITNDIHYESLTVAAVAKGVKISSVSYAAKHGTPCKGSYFVLESELYKSGDKLCAENAKANRRADKATARAIKAEAKVAAMETEMAEYRKWKVEQEKKAKAISQAELEVLKYEKKCQSAEAQCTYFQAQLDKNTVKLLKAQEKLRVLKGGDTEC